ncbi:MAG: hypothetical protein MHPDNHAH_01040 [Anaerolineales bacterium]|nr:hypothetical protein [Anaerolineales bacterium]
MILRTKKQKSLPFLPFKDKPINSLADFHFPILPRNQVFNVQPRLHATSSQRAVQFTYLRLAREAWQRKTLRGRLGSGIFLTTKGTKEHQGFWVGLQLSNSDLYRVACPLGDEDKRRRHFGSVVAYRFQSLDCKICMDVSRAKIDDPFKCCANNSHPAKVAVVSQNHPV